LVDLGVGQPARAEGGPRQRASGRQVEQLFGGEVGIGGVERATLGLPLDRACEIAPQLQSLRAPVGFANSGGLVFVDESAEKVAAA
jgi:hypothetical protein